MQLTPTPDAIDTHRSFSFRFSDQAEPCDDCSCTSSSTAGTLRQVPDLMTPIRRMDFSEPESLLQRRATAKATAKATSFLQTAEDPSAVSITSTMQRGSRLQNDWQC